MMQNPMIGQLRHRIWIGERVADPLNDGGVYESIAQPRRFSAAIEPVGTMVFQNGAQTGEAITHRIKIRWTDFPQMHWVAWRETLRPDGSTRREIFKIKRVSEINGEKRFLLLEAELEIQR